MQTLISFIIPVYNVEDYIKDCIDSIIRQNISKYEIILVDDGSTDNSGNICDYYSTMDNRIKVVHTENNGQSSARNTGISIAEGKYIAFIDSDDYYIKDSLERHISKIIEHPNVDLIIGKVKILYQDTLITQSKCNYNEFYKVEGLNGEKALNHLIKTKQFLPSVYSYFVRKDLLVENKIYFNTNHMAYEDFDFSLKVYLASKEVRVIDEFFLMYRKNRVGQITYRGNLKRDLSAFDVIYSWLKKTECLEIDKETKITLVEYLSNSYFSLLGNQYFYSWEERNIRYNTFKNGSNYIKFVTSRKLIIAKYVFQLCGFRMAVNSLMVMKYLYRAKNRLKSFKI